MCSQTSAGSARTWAATACIGAARLDHTSLASPATARRTSTPNAESGIRANPILHPPSAMLLLSPLVTNVLSGANRAGLGAFRE
ncbi:MAG TPA: hypothetical protein VG265_09445 [Gaiellaceae bacterium]|jgi:hypothetical protein|nr:hypothetical protein [Gaiellaceae bacterium]